MNRQFLQFARTAYPNQSVDAALAAPTNEQLVVYSVAAINGSAAPNDVAVAHSISPSEIVMTRTVTGVTTTVALPLTAQTTIIGTTNNDGFTISSRNKFSMLAMEQSLADGGSPVYDFEYWDGSSWENLSLNYTPDFSQTGKNVLLFEPPIDWALDADSKYSIRVRGTTAPSSPVAVTTLKVCNVISYREDVPAKGELLVRFDAKQPLLQQGEEIIGFFAFPSASNTIETSYQINP